MIEFAKEKISSLSNKTLNQDTVKTYISFKRKKVLKLSSKWKSSCFLMKEYNRCYSVWTVKKTRLKMPSGRKIQLPIKYKIVILAKGRNNHGTVKYNSEHGHWNL